MAIKANILIDQGSTYATDVELADAAGASLNLTNYTANAAMRKTYTSSNVVALGTSIDGNAGILTISMSANASANVVAGRYVYDVILTSNTGTKTRVIEGIVTIAPRVSI